MKKIFKEFKDFISKGNIIDLAVAVIIGNAFNAIISSLVKNIIMPLLSLATGGVSVADWKWVITPGDTAAGITETALYYGLFIQSVIDFIIIAFCIFVALKLMLKIKAGFGTINNKISDNILTGEDKSEMKNRGLNPKNKDDVLSYKKMKAEAAAKLEAERLLKEQEEKLKNPTELDLLKEIRDLLKER
ncbi:MAG: large conductance mechanosensitive channel protein MscL [Bacilli bacterium]|nr:large conductance mechanosensitive channel protein MscL [Bacilli bacterium]MDD4077690.1 large conductance mechanosensitive channel protein MscL [Bacilli bacterium]MDD4388317.1 large conductance mechanosensitive channel protein MscL [Bacilli bacterium]